MRLFGHSIHLNETLAFYIVMVANVLKHFKFFIAVNGVVDSKFWVVILSLFPLVLKFIELDIIITAFRFGYPKVGCLRDYVIYRGLSSLYSVVILPILLMVSLFGKTSSGWVGPTVIVEILAYEILLNRKWIVELDHYANRLSHKLHNTKKN